MREFELWLQEKGIRTNDEIVPLLRETWNEALQVAYDYLAYLEELESDIREMVDDG